MAAKTTWQLPSSQFLRRRAEVRAAVLPASTRTTAALATAMRTYTCDRGSGSDGGGGGRLHAHHRRLVCVDVALVVSRRGMHVRGKDEHTPEQTHEGGDTTTTKTTTTTDGEHTRDDDAGASNKNEHTDEQQQEQQQQQQSQQKTKKKRTGSRGRKHTLVDHLRGLREDYVKFPDIYNSATAVTFVIFTVFCLCSTGSNTEEHWWMEHWALDHHLRPYNWLLHSFLTNNFLSMTYAMMLLHSMCHLVLPTIGSRGLLLYVGSTAVLSGAVMWLGNRLVYGAPTSAASLGADGGTTSTTSTTTASAAATLERVGQRARAPEKQYGPWDVVSALFVMQYVYFGITPVRTLNSFSSWMRYACWVGQLCVMYYDWQPTLVGTAVGMALCRGVPRFRVKPMKS